MVKLPKFFLFVSLSLLLFISSSCGYRMGFGDIPQCYKTVQIPFVQGDATGAFTAVLVEELANSGAFEYRTTNADLLLCVKLLELDEKNIGFRYDRNENNQIEQTLVPAETRLLVIAEVTLFDNRTGALISGPDRIRATSEFDHEFTSSRDAVNVFSLGQVTEYEEGKVSATRPLHFYLARNIIDYLVNAW